MKYMYALIIVSGLVFVLLYSPLGRTIKSVFLIAVAQPYGRDVVEAKGSILVVGDSTAYGTGTFDPTDSIAGRIGTDFPSYSVQTISKNGATTKEVLQLLEEKDIGTYSLILIQVGGNDVLQKRDVSAFKDDIRALLVFANTHAESVVLMTAGNIGAARAFVKGGKPNEEYQRRSQELIETFAQVAEDESVAFVHHYTEPENDPFFTDPKKYMALDGLHPSAQGYGLWYEKLRPVLLSAELGK